MRVLLDCRMSSWSGVGRYTTGLARALAARADVELIQVCATGDAPPAPPGPRVAAVNTTAHPLSPHGALELGRAVRRADPDIVHCPHYPTPVPVQRPLVATIHDLIPLRVPASMPSALKRALYRQCIARAARLADCVIVPSRATSTDLARLYPEVSDRVVVTPYAADDFAAPPLGTLAGELAGKTSAPYLLTMGNTRPHKDLPTLLRAFAALAPSFQDLQLVLAGTEPPGYLPSQLASVPSDVSDRVSFTGPVSDQELRTLYAGASVFVCPSLQEGFGFPVLEAMSLGAPVVCADSSSLPEVAGDAALLFPSGDQDELVTTLTRVLRDPALRRDLMAAGRERAACFSWASTATATVAVYAAVLLGRETSASRSEDGT